MDTQTVLILVVAFFLILFVVKKVSSAIFGLIAKIFGIAIIVVIVLGFLYIGKYMMEGIMENESVDGQTLQEIVDESKQEIKEAYNLDQYKEERKAMKESAKKVGKDIIESGKEVVDSAKEEIKKYE